MREDTSKERHMTSFVRDPSESSEGSPDLQQLQETSVKRRRKEGRSSQLSSSPTGSSDSLPERNSFAGSELAEQRIDRVSAFNMTFRRSLSVEIDMEEDPDQKALNKISQSNRSVGSAAVANRLLGNRRENKSNCTLANDPRARKRRPALLVDDVKVTQRVTSVALHQAGFACDLADDGEAAVELTKKMPYHVILMDVQLPKLDGVEATKLIRSFERENPNRIPSIIFGLTGSCKEEDLDRYNDAGMDGCIEKGCIVSRAMHEALAMKKENPDEFIFINSRNVQFLRSNTGSPGSSDLNPLLHERQAQKLTQVREVGLVRRHSSATHSFQSSSSTNRELAEDVRKESMNSQQAAHMRKISSPDVLHLKSMRNKCSSSPSNCISRRKALLVDDVKITQRLTSVALSKSGYICDLAADGKTAVELARKNNYHVILMDVQLPILDGVEATKQIRQMQANDESRQSIILGLTGSCSEQNLQEYFNAGMDGCIEKGCVVSRAMHEALALREENPNVFLFIDSKNVHFRLVDVDKRCLLVPSPSSKGSPLQSSQ